MDAQQGGGARDTQRSARVHTVIDDCMRRRNIGETVRDEDIASRHADLMPELGLELRKLALIERAVRAGRSSAGHYVDARSTMPGSPIALPGYDISDEVHRGGQGVVYRATQRATNRDVAIKVMREGPLTGPNDMLRFDREVHVLGQLRHPHIVTIHDSGEVAGHFYYTMDYIDGAPLDDYVTCHDLSVKDILRLFVQVCDAVNAAHLRGVIHRDLKPSNIRVSVTGEPFVMDFGLAKVVSESPTCPAMTLTGQFVGSMPWAAPEQVDGSPARIDIRTDVYSLGVILYQILARRFPYNVTGNVRDVVDNILQAQPARPGNYCPEINDEIDTIVLRCLQKHPERRYQNAGDLARDLRHYLAGEPIEAKRDSFAYMLGKHLRRHWIPAVVACAFVFVLAGGFVASLAFWQQAVTQRDRAVQASFQEQRQRRRAEAVSQFLQDMLRSIDPHNPLGRDAKVRHVLDRAAANVSAGAFANEPDIEAALCTTIGQTYAALGLFAEAEPQQRRALALLQTLHSQFHLDVAISMNDLAVLLSRMGRYTEAEQLHISALEMKQRLVGPAHPEIVMSLANLGQVWRNQGKYAAAEARLHAALDMQTQLGDADIGQRAAVLTIYAGVKKDLGEYKTARNHFKEALRLRTELFGEQHPEVAASLNNVASVCVELGEVAEAEHLFSRALAVQRRTLGNNHPETAATLANLAVLLDERGDYASAETVYRDAVTINRALLGENHPTYATSLCNLAECLKMQGEYTEARQLLETALHIRRAAFGQEHPKVANSLNSLAGLLVRTGDLVPAGQMFREALTICEQQWGPAHPELAIPLGNLAVVRVRQGDLDGAEPLLRRALDIRRAQLGDRHPSLAGSLNNLASVLVRKDDYAAAVPLFREALAIRRATLPEHHHYTALAILNLADALHRQQQHPEAIELLYECRQFPLTDNPHSHQIRGKAASVLGAALSAIGAQAEAEPLLLEGYELLPTEPEIINRLITFYENCGRQSVADKYRTQRQQ